MVTADKFTLLREDCATIDLGGKKLKVLSFDKKEKNSKKLGNQFYCDQSQQINVLKTF